jgi:Tfp pilus assembly protein PilO
MNNLTKEKKTQLVGVVLITAIIVAGLYFGLVRAQQKGRALIENEKAEMIAKIAKAKEVIGRREQIEEDLQKASTDLATKEASMPNVGDALVWFFQIMKQATANRPLSQFQVNPNTPPHDVALLPKFPYRAVSFIQVRLNGHYDDFGKFLADFENDYPHVRVQNLSVVPSGIEEKLDFTFDVVTLVQTNAVTTAPK